MKSIRARHATAVRGPSRLTKVFSIVAALPLLVAGLVTVAGPANAVGTMSELSTAGSGFPLWYADSAGFRVEPCTDSGDAACILPAVGDEPNYDPRLPLAFPKNFPSEFFYAYSASNTISTPGCGSSPPGKASVVLALEGAFINGAPAAGDQMVFGRVRVRVSSGLCASQEYVFRQPFGDVRIRANDAGAVTAVLGTSDVGCVPGPGVPCDFSKALGSPVFGGAGGFLRWTDDAALAPGYLGDGVTPHAITGGTNGNAFAILDAAKNQLHDPITGDALSTDQFTVSGRFAGSLSSAGTDFGGVTVPAAAPVTRDITVTNIGTTSVDVAASAVVGDGVTPSPFAVVADGSTCLGAALASDATCVLRVSFTPTVVGPVSETIHLASTGGVHSPLQVSVRGTGTPEGAAAHVAVPATLDFGDVRVRTEKSLDVTVTNDGDAPLRVTHVSLGSTGQYRLASEDCTLAGGTVPAGGTCTVGLTFAPKVGGTHDVDLTLTSETVAGTDVVAVTGNATGGWAAVSGTKDADNGFPLWYRDENDVKVSQCIDPKDPYCVVLPDGGYDPAQPQVFPTNFPGEFFWTVADSEPITTPGCDGGPEGTAFIRSAVEGTFVNGVAAFDEQMVFGRVRIVVRGGLCPDTEYSFVHPYGTTKLTTNEDGSIKPIQGTVDIGCAPLPPDTCDFSLALTSPVFGGFLRWDPAVAPAAPAGYLGDAVNFHKVVGAPYTEPGAAGPANYFKIVDPAGDLVGQSNQFTVMGKLRGPLETTDGVGADGHVDFGTVPVGGTSATKTVQFTNTGRDPIDVPADAVTLTGTDTGDFQLGSETCSGRTLAVDDTCSVDVSFLPTTVGHRAASVRVVHSGINTPVVVPLDGVGGAADGQAAISFQPRAVTFPQVKVGGTSGLATVTISNAGGNVPLDITSITATGEFSVADDRCTEPVAPSDTAAEPLAPGATCQVDVIYAPTAAGPAAGNLVVTDNAPGLTHKLGLSGTASSAGSSVSAAVDPQGFPRFYSDANGVRLEPCIDTTGTCVMLPDPTYDTAKPLSFPTNFPGEFFYALADSDVVALDGCGGTTTPGQALLRVALEGTFTDGVPSFNDQMTFTRIRFTAKSGLCPFTPYNWVSPYGAFKFTTDANGGLARTDGTIDIGCAAVVGTPCDFTETLGTPVPAGSPGVPADTPAADLPGTAIDGFLRWDPNAGVAAPDGYLGDPAVLHRIVGGTYRPFGSHGPVNAFEIRDTASNLIAGTDLFTVSGKVAGPLYADRTAEDFGHIPALTTSDVHTVTVTNVGTGPATVTAAKAGPNAADWQLLDTGSCDDAAVPVDGTCTIKVAFAPATQGVKAASLRITTDIGAAGRAVVVALAGRGDPPLAPSIAVTPGVLSFGTVTAPNSSLAQTVTIRNPGSAPLLITPAAATGPAATDFAVATTCVTNAAGKWQIDPGLDCTLSVVFTPTAQGARTASIVLAHNATGGSLTVSLTATGLGSTFSLSPNPIGFSSVGINTTKSQTVSIKNGGTIAVRLTAAKVEAVTPATVPAGGVGPWGFTNGTCIGQTILPGRSCNMTVTFRPTVRGQNYSGKLTVTGDTTSLPASVSVNLTGSGK